MENLTRKVVIALLTNIVLLVMNTQPLVAGSHETELAFTRSTVSSAVETPGLTDDALQTAHPTRTATPVVRAASGSTIMPSTASDCHIAIGATPSQCAATLLVRMVVMVSHWVQSHPIEVLLRWLLGFLSSFGAGVLSQ